MKSFSNPLLIVSDNPALPGGLSRMGRDLASLCCTLPQFRVGYLGRGTGNTCRFPFVLYQYPESGQWGEAYIKDAWDDLAGSDEGVIITLDDPSRRHWFVNPTGLPTELASFLGSGRNFKRWAYFPIDSVGPGGTTLSMAGRDCVARYDRVLAASEWACDVLRCGGRADADWLPHGIIPTVFYPYKNAQSLLDWTGKVVVGAVMANQSRKDFPAAFECFAVLKAKYGNRFKAWLNTDVLMRYWNVYALAADYGVGDCLEVSTGLNDDQLALRYSACACTVLPTAGEGFGFPIAESLACGTSCVTTDYAAGKDLVPDDCRIRPMCFRVDTQHNVLRAVISGYAFAQAAIGQIEEKLADWDYRSEQTAASVTHLHWPNLRHLWERWLLAGLK